MDISDAVKDLKSSTYFIYSSNLLKIPFSKNGIAETQGNQNCWKGPEDGREFIGLLRNSQNIGESTTHFATSAMKPVAAMLRKNTKGDFMQYSYCKEPYTHEGCKHKEFN